MKKLRPERHNLSLLSHLSKATAYRQLSRDSNQSWSTPESQLLTKWNQGPLKQSIFHTDVFPSGVSYDYDLTTVNIAFCALLFEAFRFPGAWSAMSTWYSNIIQHKFNHSNFSVWLLSFQSWQAPDCCLGQVTDTLLWPQTSIFIHPRPFRSFVVFKLLAVIR